MSIDNSIVRKVGKLAKIKIKESEEKKLIDEFAAKLVLDDFFNENLDEKKNY